MAELGLVLKGLKSKENKAKNAKDRIHGMILLDVNAFSGLPASP